jgi:hypothetical protein
MFTIKFPREKIFFFKRVTIYKSNIDPIHVLSAVLRALLFLPSLLLQEARHHKFNMEHYVYGRMFLIA